MLPRHLALPFVALLLALTSCGNASRSDATTPITGDSTVDSIPTSAPEPAPSTTALAKPAVEIPSELPTTLVITDLTAGTGAAAKIGDTLVLHYVGVRSADGTEFDNSYDGGTTFDVLLGAGRVIAGWDQGLVGVKSGGQRQLDIPSDLAYADRGSGAIILPGDALTFVIDVLAVIPAVDPADEPTATLKASPNVESFTFEDLVVGEGPKAVVGQKVAIQIVAYRADTGAKINSTWSDGQAFVFTFGASEALLGLELTVDDMRVGGRRLATIPFTLAFGEAGNEALGLPPSTDMVVLVDLVAAF